MITKSYVTQKRFIEMQYAATVDETFCTST